MRVYGYAAATAFAFVLASLLFVREARAACPEPDPLREAAFLPGKVPPCLRLSLPPTTEEDDLPRFEFVITVAPEEPEERITSGFLYGDRRPEPSPPLNATIHGIPFRGPRAVIAIGIVVRR